MLIRLTVFFLLVQATIMSAQPGLYTEEEIQHQDLFLQAKTQFLLEKYAKAEELYKKALKKQPNNPAISFELSRVYAQLGDEDNVEKYIKKAINISPTNEWYGRTYISFLESKERYKDAVDVSERLARRNPDDAAIIQKHADLSIKATEYEGAIAALDRLENLVGVSENISKQKFELYRLSGKKNEAVKELNKLVNQNPNNVRYLNNLASYYKEIGKEKDAKKTYQRVLSVDPNDPTANMALTTTNSNNPDVLFLQSVSSLITKEDISIDKKVIELIPYVTRIDALDQAAVSALMNNLRALQKTHSNDAKSYAILGDAHMGQGELEDAVSNYREAVRLTKNVFPVWEQLLFGLEQLGEYEEMGNVADEALNYYPNQPICYYYLGKSFSARIESELTKEDLFLKGMKMSEAKKERSSLYSSAMENFEEAILMSAKNKPFKYQVYRTAAQAAYNYGDFKKAAEYADDAQKIGPNKKDPALEDLLDKIQNSLN